jgi:retron-type reverse transcriptase
MKNTKIKLSKIIKSKIIFSKPIAIRFAKMEYYKSNFYDIQNHSYREKMKRTIYAPRNEFITQKIASYKKLLQEKTLGHFKILKGIYETNKLAAINKQVPAIHTNIFNLVGSIPTLITSYKKIKGNKGSMTLGAMLSFHKLRRMNTLQRRILSSTTTAPDGLSYEKFQAISNLLKDRKYPWGASKRIYIDKPGQPTKKRPLTIPPFTDRIIQTNILQILQAIYEPWFEIQNVSFGFREKKGVHDAIYSASKQENKGLYTIIEGDIEGAYDNVDREKLITILSKRINDKKFLNLIRDRLNYCYLDPVTNKYIEEDKGIPQGGVDSPYLWNIYMKEFDDYVLQYMDNLLKTINLKVRGNDNTRNRKNTGQFNRLITKKRSLRKYLTNNNKGIPVNPKDRGIHLKEIQEIANKTKKKLKYVIIKQIKLVSHKMRNLPASDPNKQVLRYSYTRYADDWIILGNFPKLLAENIRKDLAHWLETNLSAKLSIEKTLIKDIRKNRSRGQFLGFEIRSYSTRKLAYKYNSATNKKSLTRVAGAEIKLYPDHQRLISRLHMKGYCDSHGNPIPMSWLSTMETTTLIMRFNAVLVGLGNFYHNWVPKSSLTRWIYIIRFCLFKTLAQKYDTNIRGIFKKFGTRTSTGNTIHFTVKNKVKDKYTKKIETYTKSWTLYTEKDIQEKCINKEKYDKVRKTYNSINYDQILPSPPWDNTYSFPSIKDDTYLEKMAWVNLRTMANYDFPCSLCGAPPPTQMHHIKHIRKITLSKIPNDQPHLKIMYLRNRRQIPVCTNCHINIIHKGIYKGIDLRNFIIQPYNSSAPYDTRLVNIENQIKSSNTEFYGKTLEEKGWKKEQESN